MDSASEGKVLLSPDCRLGVPPKRLFMNVSGRGESTITDFLQIVADAGLLLNIGAIRAGVDWKPEGLNSRSGATAL